MSELEMSRKGTADEWDAMPCDEEFWRLLEIAAVKVAEHCDVFSASTTDARMAVEAYVEKTMGDQCSTINRIIDAVWWAMVAQHKHSKTQGWLTARKVDKGSDA